MTGHAEAVKVVYDESRLPTEVVLDVVRGRAIGGDPVEIIALPAVTVVDRPAA